MSNPKLKKLAKNLSKEFPRSPRETIAGYVLAARCIDKCRAEINGTAGEYHFNCPLDQIFLKFAKVDAKKLKAFVATGATDDEIAAWIGKNSKKRPRVEIIKWNNKQRDLRLSDLSGEVQEYLEDYIPQFVPPGKVVYTWFDVYDYEEKRR